MKYMRLIYDSEHGWERFSEADRKAGMGEYRQFSQQISASGQMLGGSQLQPIATATSVRIRDDKQLLTDGPFAETNEQLGGYYLVEARDLNEALSLAARIPSARFGTVEVRPL